MKSVFSNRVKLILTSFFILMFISACDKEVSRSPIEPPPPQGFMYVKSTPSGSTIFQNGRNTGRKTPDSLSYIEPGVYEITLKRKYFKDTTINVAVSEEELAVVDIDYLSNPTMFGSLSLFTQPPGAMIILNDSTLSRVTPDTIQNLLPGKYDVEFRLFNHRDLEIETIVESSEINFYAEELRDTSVWIDFQVFNSGIQSNALSAIAIDQNGVKWIGSLTDGLISYDDINFVVYNELNSPLPDNRVNCISVDQQNNIWIGTDFGIAIFNGASWTIYNRDNSGLTSEIINSIKFDSDGNTWIGTTSGLVRFDGIDWQIFNDTERRIWAMDCDFDNTGVTWIGTKREGIFTLENEILTFFPDSLYNYPTVRISSVAKDRLGNIWFCHMPDSAKISGVSYWDGNMFSNLFLGTPDNDINHIHIDNDNNKWISTGEGFVLIDAGNVSQSFTTLNSLISSDQTYSSVRDNIGNVWITTVSAGLNKFKPPR